MPSIKKYCNFEDILVKCKPSLISKNFMAVWMDYIMDLALKKLLIKNIYISMEDKKADLQLN